MRFPIRFGKYELLERIAAGGMAEVYRATLSGPAGFSKTLAVKQILPQFASSETFTRLFVEEAKLSVSLTHGNIVPTYELGRINGIYYIAMEYIHGQNLARLLERGTATGTPLPTSLAIFIAIEVLKGLDYAHRRRDEQGKPLGIVHRDVTPPNVLISYEGEVKLADFGIAKALLGAASAVDSQPGVVRGKYSYLAPEQVEGGWVDARTDIFAAGIVLFEMLTGRRLFRGSSHADTLRRVAAAQVPPPSQLRPEIPRELDAIVLRALAHDARDRYADANQLALALSRLLFAGGGGATSHDLGALIRVLFSEQLHDRTTAGGSDQAALPANVDQMPRLGEGDTIDGPGLPDGRQLPADGQTDEDGLRPENLPDLTAVPAVEEAVARLTARSSPPPLPPIPLPGGDSSTHLPAPPDTPRATHADPLGPPDLPAPPDLLGRPHLLVSPDVLGLPDLTGSPDLLGSPDLPGNAALETGMADDGESAGTRLGMTVLGIPGDVDFAVDVSGLHLASRRRRPLTAWVWFLLLLLVGGSGLLLLAVRGDRLSAPAWRPTRHHRPPPAVAGPGTLTVGSLPEGAAVYLALGRAPVTAAHLDVGQLHELRIEHAGYRALVRQLGAADWHKIAEVRPGEQRDSYAAEITLSLVADQVGESDPASGRAVAAHRRATGGGRQVAVTGATNGGRASAATGGGDAATDAATGGAAGGPIGGPTRPAAREGTVAGGNPIRLYGSARVQTTPPGASVFLLVGHTPQMRLTEVDVEREHELLLLRDGYQPALLRVQRADWGRLASDDGFAFSRRVLLQPRSGR